MKDKLSLVVGVALLVVLGLGITFPRGNSVVERVIERVGAVSTLDGVDNPRVQINGVETHNSRVSMTATSSVVCALANPFNATSTVVFPITIDVTANGIGATNLYVSTSTSMSATTTSNSWTGRMTLDAGNKSQFLVMGNSATTSASLGLTSQVLGADNNIMPGLHPRGYSNYVVGPTQNLLVAIGTSSAGTFSTYLTGSCEAEFRKVN